MSKGIGAQDTNPTRQPNIHAAEMVKTQGEQICWEYDYLLYGGGIGSSVDQGQQKNHKLFCTNLFIRELQNYHRDGVSADKLRETIAATIRNDVSRTSLSWILKQLHSAQGHIRFNGINLNSLTLKTLLLTTTKPEA